MKKWLCSAALALALCLALPCPALAAEEASPRNYEEAVAELRNEDMYAIYDTIDTELCTVFLYRRIGTPHIQLPRVDILYKNGTVARLDLSPEKIRLSEDGEQLVCTSSFNPSWGTRVYTVELSSGEIVGEDCILPTQEQLFGWFLGESRSTEERRLEGAEDTVLLFSSDEEAWGRKKEYFLYLICREPARRADPDGWFRRLVLPSTTAVGEKYPQYPTDRAPDEMFLNEDGSVLTYIYRFSDSLSNADGELLHDAGTYTYRVDTATGELKVEFEKNAGAEGTTFVDVAPGDWFAPYVNVCVEAGLMKGVGGGRFDPQGTVSLAQAATLAARIHHIKNGGNGVLPQAPENYGTVTLEFENGLRLRFDSAECGTTISPMSRGHLWADLSEEKMEAMERLGVGKEAQAKVWVVLPEPAGPYSCEVHRRSGSDGDALVLYPSPDGTPEDREAVNNLVGALFKAHRRPLPGDWYRDTVCYLEKQGLTSPLVLRTSEPDRTADRGDFVEALHATAADMLTPKLNDITDFPDAEPEYDGKGLADMVLDFYNAGVMMGKDGQGTFDKDSTLTRAEAAAICARILKRELRVKFQPEPVPEKYFYTLTYLMDDPMDGHTVTYPVMPIIGGANSGILTLDGDLLPWPGEEGKPANMLATGTGGGLYLSFWFTQPDGTKVEKGGLMDETGTFVVPLNDYCYRATSLSSGKYLSQTGLPENGVCTLWDGEGNATELGSMDWYKTRESYGYPPYHKPDIDRGRNCYVDSLGHRVSEDFDWMGALTDDGRGFVGKDGKIYRIEFKEL